MQVNRQVFKKASRVLNNRVYSGFPNSDYLIITPPKTDIGVRLLRIKIDHFLNRCSANRTEFVSDKSTHQAIR